MVLVISQHNLPKSCTDRGRAMMLPAVWSTGSVTGDMETRGIVIEEGAVLRGKVEVRQKDQPPQPPRSAVPAHTKEPVATDSAQAKQQAMEEGARREV